MTYASERGHQGPDSAHRKMTRFQQNWNKKWEVFVTCLWGRKQGANGFFKGKVSCQQEVEDLLPPPPLLCR